VASGEVCPIIGADMTKHKCSWCGKTIKPISKVHRFCKDTCRAAWRYANFAECGCGCGKKFLLSKSQKGQRTKGRSVYYNYDHYYKVMKERNRDYRKQKKYKDYQSQYYQNNKNRILSDVKKNPNKETKNKYKCQRCGDSAFPNRFWCPPCHSIISSSIDDNEHYCAI